MHLVKKIEVIANSFELHKILDELKTSGVHCQAVIRNVSAEGLRNDTTEDFDTMMEDNVYILAFCAPDKVKEVVTNIKPLLNKFGGTCYISDVMEIRSIKCIASL
jgi:nitrogen regulatory protein PII